MTLTWRALWLGWETADQSGKWPAGSWTADERGLRVQSPIQAPGGGIKRQPLG